MVDSRKTQIGKGLYLWWEPKYPRNVLGEVFLREVVLRRSKENHPIFLSCRQ